MKDAEAKQEQRYCKKCKTPLPSDWKYRKCENCRRESAERRRNAALGVAGAATTALVVARDKIVPVVTDTVLPAVKKHGTTVINIAQKVIKK